MPVIIKMQHILFTIFVLSAWCLSNNSVVGPVNCETIDPHFKGDYPHPYFKDYVRAQLLERATDTIHISNRTNLTSVKPFFCSDDEIIFQWDTFQLFIKKKKVPFCLFQNVNLVALEDTVTNFITSIESQPPYGLNYPEDTVEIISEIRYIAGWKEIEIPSRSFQNLFYPSFRVKQEPIHPVEMYRNNGYTYLYIFGANPKRPQITDVTAYDTYMAKLIFNSSGFQTRIVASGGVLTAYQWACKNFIGF